MGAKQIVRHWLVRRKEMTRLQQRRGHGEAQAVPLPVLESDQKSDLSGTEEIGAESQNIKEGMEMAKRHRDGFF